MVLLVFLLGITHEGTQLADLSVDVAVEIEPVLLSAADLQQIVVEGLLGDAYFTCGLL